MPLPKYPTSAFSTAVKHNWTATQTNVPEAIAYAAAIALDPSLRNSKVKTTLTGNTTITVANTGNEGDELMYTFLQDGTGSRTVTWVGVTGVAGYVDSTASSTSTVYLERVAAGWIFTA